MDVRAQKRIPNVLTIAGIDPSGGAGLLADVKAMSALGAYAAGVPAALTAQNMRGVAGVMPIPAAFVEAELEAVFSDLRIDAVKIGMLNDAAVIETVASQLEKYAPRWVVVDPVMVAKSGDRLLREDALEALKRRLMPLATLVTPNLPEAAELLAKGEMTSRDEMSAAAREIRTHLHPEWVLVKGGHLSGDDSADCLCGPEDFTEWFSAARTHTKNTHGTGCTLSSAIAALLPQTESVPLAVKKAKEYLSGAIQHADELSVGSGHGPTHHFWQLWQQM